MQVEMWSLDRIKPYENNPRINDDAVDAVVQSINEFGFRQPIVVDTDGVIIVGHTRYKAAKKLELDKVPVHVAKDMEPEAVRAYRIADNPHNDLLVGYFGVVPPIADPDRKAKASRSFQYFCEAYFSLTFHLAWSPDHLKVITKIEEAVTKGGLFSLAMARGSGKSSIAEVACIWAVLNGYRDFVCLIGSDERVSFKELQRRRRS